MWYTFQHFKAKASYWLRVFWWIMNCHMIWFVAYDFNKQRKLSGRTPKNNTQLQMTNWAFFPSVCTRNRHKSNSSSGLYNDASTQQCRSCKVHNDQPLIMYYWSALEYSTVSQVHRCKEHRGKFWLLFFLCLVLRNNLLRLILLHKWR